MLALALASLVGLAVLALLGTLGTATQARYDTRDAVTNRQLTSARIQAMIRGSVMILALKDNQIVLWTGDANLNGVPNISELRLIERDQSSNEVRVYECSKDLGSADTSYELSEDFDAVAHTIAGTALLPGQVLLKQVSAMDCAVQGGSVQDVRTIRVRLTSSLASGEDTTTVVASIRDTAR